MEKVIQNIREYRKVSGLSQSYMAERLGIAVINYGKIERGETELTVKRLYEIAEILNVSIAEILGISNPYEIDRLKMSLQTLNVELDIEKNKRERLKYEVGTFLIVIKDVFQTNKYFKLIKGLLPKTSEFLELLEETERKIREDN